MDKMNKNEELISIIVPVYNAEKYLERCIESVLKSTYKALELILVDDGSEDLSSEICETYAAPPDDPAFLTPHTPRGGGRISSGGRNCKEQWQIHNVCGCR